MLNQMDQILINNASQFHTNIIKSNYDEIKRRDIKPMSREHCIYWLELLVESEKINEIEKAKIVGIYDELVKENKLELKKESLLALKNEIENTKDIKSPFPMVLVDISLSSVELAIENEDIVFAPWMVNDFFGGLGGAAIGVIWGAIICAGVASVLTVL